MAKTLFREARTSIRWGTAVLLATIGCGETPVGPELDASVVDVPPVEAGYLDGVSADAPSRDGSIGEDVFVPSEDDGLHPRLSNFRVEAPSSDRVYFDSSEAVVGTSVEGFVVSGVEIASVTILANRSSGHYLTASEPFTFWDNNTIRYEGGSDIADSDGNPVFEFDLQNIENAIPEPSALTDRFVSATALGGGDGSVGSEWTFVEAGMNAIAGETVHVKAGDYGPAEVVVFNSGTAQNPIKFVGYGAVPGDNPDLGWSYPDSTDFDSSVMPLLNGGDELASTRGLETRGSYIIIKNVQIQEYQRLLFVQRPASFVVVDNVFVRRGIYGFHLDSEEGEHNRITNSVAYQTQTSGFRLYGDFNRIEGCRVYDDRNDGDESYSMDYYISFKGENNIIRNCYLERFGNTTHTGHGLSCKANGGPVTQHNLSENVEVVGIKLAIEVWHTFVGHNVFRNIRSWRRTSTDKSTTGGIDVLRGAHDNIFDRITVTDTGFGVYFNGSGNNNNLFKNSVFTGNSTGIRIDDPTEGNRFVGCVFHDSNSLVSGSGASGAFDNQLINTSVSAVPMSGDISGFEFSYSNVWDSFGAPAGDGVLSADPVFANAAAGDFNLTEESPASLRQGGTEHPRVRYDMDGRERTAPYCIGAAERD